jgi:uncharacterized protein (DUF1501 family)
VLVCIFLRGGADTLNLLVPHGDDAYFRARPTLAIRDAIPIDDFYGLHPKAAPLVPLFREGRLGFVQAVGCDDASGSHFVVQDRVEHGESGSEKESGGWLARYLRSRGQAGALGAIAIGERIPEALRGAPQATAMRQVSEIAMRRPSARRTLRALYATSADSLLMDPARATFALLERIEAEGERATPNSDRSDDDLGAGLHEIARLVHADVGLDVACLDLGGWDTHFVQASLHAAAVDRLSTALAGFESALGPRRDSVTTVVMTEFGRRTQENGSVGTDHGRGYAMMVLGSKRIAGGKVHGEWPGLEEDFAAGPGGLRVVTDYRRVLADVIEENGASRRAVFPSLPA